jgi:hypothetical protein
VRLKRTGLARTARERTGLDWSGLGQDLEVTAVPLLGEDRQAIVISDAVPGGAGNSLAITR